MSVDLHHGLQTDAALLIAIEEPGGGLAANALQATFVKHQGESLAESGEPEDFHLSVSM